MQRLMVYIISLLLVTIGLVLCLVTVPSASRMSKVHIDQFEAILRELAITNAMEIVGQVRLQSRENYFKETTADVKCTGEVRYSLKCRGGRLSVKCATVNGDVTRISVAGTECEESIRYKLTQDLKCRLAGHEGSGIKIENEGERGALAPAPVKER